MKRKTKTTKSMPKTKIIQPKEDSTIHLLTQMNAFSNKLRRLGKSSRIRTSGISCRKRIHFITEEDLKQKQNNIVRYVISD